MLCQTTKMITCYQCSLQQQLYIVNRFPRPTGRGGQKETRVLFSPFIFLNKISELFSLRTAECPALLKETARFIVKAEPVENGRDQPFYQPSTVYSTKDFINSLEGHAFKKCLLPITRECQFSILAFPVSMMQLKTTCGKTYGFNIFCIPVAEDTRDVFVLHFNYVLCPIEERFVKGVQRIFKHIKSKSIKISQFSWFVEPMTVQSQPPPTLFIKAVAETEFTDFFDREHVDSSDFSNSDFKAQLARITWKAELPSHIDFKLVSKSFKMSFTKYKEKEQQLAINQCICCLCQSSYPTMSQFSVYRCKPTRYTLLANSIVYCGDEE